MEVAVTTSKWLSSAASMGEQSGIATSFRQQSHAECMQVNRCTNQKLQAREALEIIQTKKPLKTQFYLQGFRREPYLVVLLKSEVLFSSTGARNFKKFGTEEEE